MAVGALNLAACLRPWRGAGVFAFLSGERGRPAQDDFAGGLHGPLGAIPAGAAPLSEIFSPGPAGFPYPSSPVFDPAGAEVRNARTGAGSTASGGGPVGKDGGRTFPAAGGSDRPASSVTYQSGKRAAVPVPEGNSPPLARPAPAYPAPPCAAEWTAPWRGLLNKTPSAPLVWTYEELGRDLQGEASGDRSRHLRALIGALALPRGSSAFWPLDLPPVAETNKGASEWASSARASDAEIDLEHAGAETGSAYAGGMAGPEYAGVAEHGRFAAGVRLLGAGVVIYFGAGAAMRSGFALELRNPFSLQIAQGLQHIILPSLAVLAESPEQSENAVVFLRSVLSDHPRLKRGK